MKKFISIVLVLGAQLAVLGQQEDAWVYFTDKENVSASLTNPISIVTQKALDRKSAHGVPIDYRDVPVNEMYITQLKAINGISVLAKSKWFNAVHVRGLASVINSLEATFTFIDHITFANKNLKSKLAKQYSYTKSKLETNFTEFNYGEAANQIEMFNGHKLHLDNYTGDGVTIAVIDAGFPLVNTLSAFKRLRDAGRLIDTYDFVTREIDVYHPTKSNHGTLVLSTMAGYIDNQYVGTAPDASYYLFRTENAPTENPVEESYWVEAVERADSLGVDIINTSLGYTTYDNSNYSHTNADMDGNTTFITKGANIAFEKGLLLVNSAGNSGNSAWKIIGAPADASGVLSVGAVKPDGTYASFSSMGNESQQVLKPDIVAQGQTAYVINLENQIVTANGTSFSAPILAGGIACLRQAMPNKTNAEIMQLVRASASQYNNPDYFLGHGIPNLELAFNTSLSMETDLNTKNLNLIIYPNPSKDFIYVNLKNAEQEVSISVFDILGKQMNLSSKDDYPIVDIRTLPEGVYVLKIKSTSMSETIKFIKN